MRNHGALALLLSAVLFPAVAHAQRGAAQIRIQQKPLGAALVDFAVQANISIATPSGGFGGAQAAGIRGDYAVDEALGLLLHDTGYSFEQVDAVTFRIVRSERGPRDRPIETAAARDVLVTGVRRPNMLDRLPSAVTSTSGALLDAAGGRQTADVAFDAAGLTLTNLGPGRNKILIRGLSDGAFSGRTQSTVAIYLDDSRVTYGAPDPELQLVDVDAVEVLRGPRGTSYGAGPLGGIYRIVSRAPDLKQTSASVLVATESLDGGGQGSEIEATLNAPIAPEQAALRFVAYHQQSPGWLDNPGLGRTNANTTQRDGGRVSGLVRVGDTWTLNARVASQRIASDDSQYIDQALSPDERTTRVLEPHATDFFLASAGGRGALAGGELFFTTSYTNHSRNERYDAANGAFVFGLPRGMPAAFDDDATTELTVQEARYSAVASPFPWYVGVFRSSLEKRTQSRLLLAPDRPDATSTYNSWRADSLNEYALIGDAAFAPFPKTQLSLAARVFWSDLSTRAVAVGDPVDAFEGRRRESGVAPKIEFSYTPAPRTFLYASAAKGYRTGGFNAGFSALFTRAPQPARTYRGDNLWSYEAGVKQAWLQGRLHVRAAVFWQRWRDVQSDQLIANGLAFTGNVGDAKSFGAESEFTAQVTQRLQLRAHASYTEADITRVDPTFPAQLHAGLPGAPRFLAGASFLYERPLTGALRLAISGKAVYVGHSNVTYTLLRELQVGGYSDIGLRAGVLTEAWRASVYIDNLADTQRPTFSYANPLRFGGAGLVTPQRPRAIGVELARAF
ncbi:MAG: TonB-dependent receptor [Hyphomonadaceae bacterium]